MSRCCKMCHNAWSWQQQHHGDWTTPHQMAASQQNLQYKNWSEIKDPFCRIHRPPSAHLLSHNQTTKDGRRKKRIIFVQIQHTVFDLEACRSHAVVHKISSKCLAFKLNKILKNQSLPLFFKHWLHLRFSLFKNSVYEMIFKYFSALYTKF